MIVVGLMSGTSADGVDAAVVEFAERGGRCRLTLRAFVHQDYPADLRAAVFRACSPTTGTVDHLCRLNVLLGEAFAQAALAAIRAAGLEPEAIDLIASHGQTVFHQAGPTDWPRATLQIGEPAVIAERTGLTTVANFRPRDLAAGGLGAPLVSYVDYLLFRDRRRCRAIQNLGGIANVTVLPPGAGPEAVFAFDTGPGNMVIDAVVERLTGGALRCDRDGRLAARGRPDERILSHLLADPYFQQPPPKTTGRERFGAHHAARLLELAAGLPVEDIVATATMLTVRSIAEAYRRFLPPVDEVILGGGGSHNPTLVAWLRAALAPARVRTHAEFGLLDQAKEALAFAVLGYQALHGRPNTLPGCTGARRAVVAGTLVPGRNYRALLARIARRRREPRTWVFVTSPWSG